jgi:hypothetical protein
MTCLTASSLKSVHISIVAFLHFSFDIIICLLIWGNAMFYEKCQQVWGECHRGLMRWREVGTYGLTFTTSV